MKKIEVISYFGEKQIDVVRALGCSKATVSLWPDKIPEVWATKLHVLTDGKLRCNPSDYDMRLHT